MLVGAAVPSGIVPACREWRGYPHRLCSNGGSEIAITPPGVGAAVSTGLTRRLSSVDSPVIGSGDRWRERWVVLDRVRWRSGGSARGGRSVGSMEGYQVTDQDVIDELGVAAVDAQVVIFGGLDAWVEVLQPGPSP
jgi:hypothetical protein